MNWNITPPDPALAAAIQQKIDTKTKPLGALGQLESLARQVALVQQTLTPELHQPHVLVFAADHGIAQAGVSQYPPEVTHQMVRNFAGGGAAINVFCRQNGLGLTIVDAGVRGSLTDLPTVRPEKLAEGTQNFLHTPAMTAAQCADALWRGARLVDELHAAGCNVLGLGEMGIGNTASAALLMHRLAPAALDDCMGVGAGHDAAGLARKRAALIRAAERSDAVEPFEVLSQFGGYEIAMMAGAIHGAADRDTPVIVDGFICTAAALVAVRLRPETRRVCLFAHRSAEAGHARMLQALDARPLLDLNLRLGEGTGALLAAPLVRAATALLSDVASLDDVMAGRL